MSALNIDCPKKIYLKRAIFACAYFDAYASKQIPGNVLNSKRTINQLLLTGERPGILGVTIEGRFNFTDLWKLTTKHEGIEFALTREMVNGKGLYKLYAGESNQVLIPRSEGMRILAHSHPAGAAESLPSFADINTLNKLYGFELDMNPMARPYPSRVVWGPSIENITVFRPTLENVNIECMKRRKKRNLGIE